MSEQYWRIVFEDADVPDEVFTDEQSARARHKERLNNWACHLYIPEAELARLREENKNLKDALRKTQDSLIAKGDEYNEAAKELNRVMIRLVETERENGAIEKAEAQRDTYRAALQNIIAMIDGEIDDNRPIEARERFCRKEAQRALDTDKD